jgi:hypothetical protein
MKQMMLERNPEVVIIIVVFALVAVSARPTIRTVSI